MTSPVTMTDSLWMERALNLAQRTEGLASPNPQVGCVLVRDGVLVGEGAHIYDLRKHAEVVALEQAGERAAGTTAYVTLEPCSHHGRTPPCAGALIAGRVARCLVATLDPNPQVSGRGVALLRNAGVQIEVGLLEAAARNLNDAFGWTIRHKTPFVTLKSAVSTDGQIAPSPSVRTRREPYWLTGPESRAQVQQLRHASDAIVTGIGTVLADDPLLSDRTGLPRRRKLLRVVLDAELRLPLESRLVQTAESDLLVFCRVGAPGIGRLQELGIEVRAVPFQNKRLDLPTVLEELARLQINSVLLEAGSQMNGAFLRGDHVHQVALFYSETELGLDAIPFAEDVGGPFLLEQRLTKLQRTTLGADVLIRGYLHDPWAEVASGLL